MLTVLVVCNVLILMDSAPALLVTRVWNMILHVVVIQLDQAAQHVISLQANVLVMLDTMEPYATLVTLTIIEQVMEHAQVSTILFKHSLTIQIWN